MDSKTIIMKKAHSPHLVKIYMDPEDNHFSIVELVRIATKTVAASHYILTSDTAQWQSYFESDGFIKNE